MEQKQSRKIRHIPVGAVPAICLIAAVSLLAGYSIWFRSYQSWPFDDVYFPYPRLKDQRSVIDTKDWKNFRNEQFGFGLKYPNEFNFLFDPAKKVLVLAVSPENKEFSGMSLIISDNKEGLDLKTWWKNNNAYNSRYISENIKGDGVSGLKVYSPDLRVSGSYVFLSRDKSIYEFHWTLLNDKVAEQILSSVYFFTPVPPTPAANPSPSGPGQQWRTYRSIQHSFELQYPDNVSVTAQADASVRFTASGSSVGVLPLITIHSMEVSNVTQLWLNDVLPNYTLNTGNQTLGGQAVTTAKGTGEYKNYTLYIIPKASGTSALVEVSNSSIGKQILATFKFTK